MIAVSVVQRATGALRGHESLEARIRIALVVRDGEEFRPSIKRGGHEGLCIGGVWTTGLHGGEIEGVNAGYRRGSSDSRTAGLPLTVAWRGLIYIQPGSIVGARRCGWDCPSGHNRQYEFQRTRLRSHRTRDESFICGRMIDA